MKVLVFSAPGGGVAVDWPGPKFVASFKSEAAGLAALQSDIAKRGGTDIEIVEHTVLPSREFRDAWQRDVSPAPEPIKFDMAKARDIHMDRIRKAREPEFEKADNELKVAEDSGDAAEIARIRAKRQALRDIPQTFDLSGAITPEELAALWPAELPPEQKRS